MQHSAQSVETPLDKEPRIILIREVTTARHGVAPTGRVIHMLEDSPLFASWGEMGKRAIQEGQVAIDRDLFCAIAAIISDCTVQEVGNA